MGVILVELLEKLYARIKKQADWHESEAKYLRKANAELRREILKEIAKSKVKKKW